MYYLTLVFAFNRTPQLRANVKRSKPRTIITSLLRPPSLNSPKKGALCQVFFFIFILQVFS